MGECYNPYPKLPKNIRQIGERDPVMKLYVEDYVNTYLRRLSPTGGRDLRVGLLLGEIRTEEGMPFVFVDGAMEMEEVAASEEHVEFTESAWKRAWQTIEQSFPRRTVLGWFLCGAQGCMLSPLNYWRAHGQYFSAKYQLMYLNSSLDGDEALYMASEDGFYKLRGYCIYYERNQMMQDYMISRKDARRVESGTRDEVIRDFRQKMEDRRLEVRKRSAWSGILGSACGVLSVAVLACGVVMFNNYHKMKEMEAVLASVVPTGSISHSMDDEVEIREIAGEIYPTPEPEDGKKTAEESISLPEQEENRIAGGNMTAGSTAGAVGQAEGEMKLPQAVQETPRAETTPAKTEAAEVSSNAVTHIVQEGETLYGICLSRYHSLALLPEICRMNGLEDENRLTIGQKLLLPPGNQ
jgi:hypothetical protein